MNQVRYNGHFLNNSAAIPALRRTSISGLSEIRSRVGGPVGSVARSKSQIACDDLASVAMSSARKSKITEMRTFRGLGRTPDLETRQAAEDTNSILRSEMNVAAE